MTPFVLWLKKLRVAVVILKNKIEVNCCLASL